MRSSGKGVLGRGTASVRSFERREILTLNRKRISRFEASMPTAWKEGTRPADPVRKGAWSLFHM